MDNHVFRVEWHNGDEEKFVCFVVASDSVAARVMSKEAYAEEWSDGNDPEDDFDDCQVSRIMQQNETGVVTSYEEVCETRRIWFCKGGRV